MFAPQSKKTTVELVVLALVPTQIITPAKSTTIIGIIQDPLVGTFKLTAPNVVPMSKQTFFNAIGTIPEFDGRVEIKSEYTGADLMSEILPPLNYKSFNHDLSPIAQSISDLISFVKNSATIENLPSINYYSAPEIKNEINSRIGELLKLELSDRESKLLRYIKSRLADGRVQKLGNAFGELAQSLRERKTTESVSIDITRGRLIKGQIGNKMIKPGGGDGNLIFSTTLDIGKYEARNFINRIQKVINSWLLNEGHTIGLGDMIAPKTEIANEVNFNIAKSLAAYDALVEKLEKAELIPGIGRSIEDEFEFQAKLIFGDLFGGKLPKILSSAIKKAITNLHNMVASGSKGSSVNVTQIMGCVGSQIIGGQRIPMAYGNRTLPHYPKFDQSAQSRGFIKNSYMQGLDPDEFFFHMASGREGSIDTAIKSVVGETAIIIRESTQTRRVMIGDWIDELMNIRNHEVIKGKHEELALDAEKLELNQDVWIPTTDLKGRVSWGKITAVTRHLPTNTLYKITTNTGREVTVTDSHSLLVYNNKSNTLERRQSRLVKVGDCVPVTLCLPQPPNSIHRPDVSPYHRFNTYPTHSTPFEELTQYIEMDDDETSSFDEELESSHYLNTFDTLAQAEMFGMVYSRCGLGYIIKNSDNNNYQVKGGFWTDKLGFGKTMGEDSDIILDEIISIEHVSGDKYEYVYDLTVPSTLNFGLANGLHVVDTAESGYISRKLMKAAEDIQVNYDLVVRNSINQVITTMYGDNGLNPSLIRHVKIKLIDTDNQKLRVKYLFTIDEIKRSVDPSIHSEIFDKKHTTSTMQMLNTEYLKIAYFRKVLREYVYEDYFGDVDFLSPVNIAKMIVDTKVQLESPTPKLSLIDPLYVIQKVNGMCELLPKLFQHVELTAANYINLDSTLDDDYIAGKSESEILNSPLDIDEFLTLTTRGSRFEIATLLLRIYLRSQLSAKQIIMEYGLNKPQFDYLIDSVVQNFARAIIDPGTMVGPIAAQSIGEPTTQATLNTFHLAGVAAKSAVIAGLPRIKELISATKQIKTPYITARMRKEFAEDKYRAKIIANTIEYTTLRAFATLIEIYFDPSPTRSIIESDKAFVKAYYANTLTTAQLIPKLSKYVLRVVLDKSKVIYKQLRMSDIKIKIEDYKGGLLNCVMSDDNADELVLHIRLDMSLQSKSRSELDLILDYKDTVLDDIVIRGIKDIKSAQIDNSGDKLIVYDPDTGTKQIKDEWAIYTDGTNLKYVLSEDGVDAARTASNDVNEVLETLGIEAARQLLYDQLNETFSQTGANINYHHLGLFVDLMTFYGKVMPINRHGINRTENSVLMKASFEETLEQLSEASIFGDIDNLKSPSANIMLGQMMNCGTGANMDVLYDYTQTRKGVKEDEIDELIG